ncbi:hypothetical protein ALI144C_02290 [Actinosynnema sp. ALI-1.44]|uniref:hypothetical protein n=1 Tax=Actinosynnema sp. ALI-1.44 TaxID=1933779 RepID=UPI00097BEBAB|nr:hypothetical protein [Actinosynnema sp. ALI-1.44]ONI90805.1 hypothetical protein ALI144C_02290 [Actinosynnema sp. ALI-1.44]
MVTPIVVPDASQPVHVSAPDTAELIERQTKFLREMDHRSGGGSCLDGALTLIHRIRHLPGSPHDIEHRRRDVAVADLHNLVGWASFDIGLTHQAHRYFSQALALAGRGGDARLIADIFHRLGRMRLHEDSPVEALDYLQFGLLAADAPGGEITTSILLMNQAWAYAMTGTAALACQLVDRGHDLFTAAAASDRPGWSSFVTETDMLAMTGTVYSELAHRVDPSYARTAIPHLTQAIDGYGDPMARSRTFTLILLAMSHLVDGEVDEGVEMGSHALACAENLASVRVHERMLRLKADAERHDTHTGARKLATRIAALTIPPGHTR